MLARTFSATMAGLKPIKIEIEVNAGRGIPTLVLIGLPSKAVEESKERITTALRNCGIRIKSQRVVVNLAPADLKKNRPTFELAIAIGMLKSYGEIKAKTDDTILFGELSLGGEIKAIKGALPLILAARQMGFKKAIIPSANSDEVSIITGIDIHPISHLKTYLHHLKTKKPLPQLTPSRFTLKPTSVSSQQIQLHDVKDQALAKRALEIAVAGGHNLMLIGPPGSGKSMLAQAMTTIMPPLNKKEAIEVTTIYSVAGLNAHSLITTRPFRAPHHSTSHVGLIGGGRQLNPGEISLAHRGVLFLDEFTEFNRRPLESLRQPLENKTIKIVRAHGRVSYPAAFSLVAAANPCPCGWAGSQQKACRCSDFAKKQYQRKFSGPILDRIDLFVRVKPVDLRQIHSKEKSTATTQTQQIINKIKIAKKIQAKLLHNSGCITNSELNSKQIKKYFSLNSAAQKIINKAATNLSLTARSYFRLIKVAQTIANLEGKTTIESHHLTEALQYRQEKIF
jgi:magnesium chelatase family protein